MADSCRAEWNASFAGELPSVLPPEGNHMKLTTIALAAFFAFGSTLALAQGAGGGAGGGAGAGGAGAGAAGAGAAGGSGSGAGGGPTTQTQTQRSSGVTVGTSGTLHKKRASSPKTHSRM